MKKHLFDPDMLLFKIPVQLTYMTCKWVKVINKLRPVHICSQTSLINFSSEKWKQRGNDSTHEKMTAMFTDSVNSKLHKARLSVSKIIKSDFTDSGFATASLLKCNGIKLLQCTTHTQSQKTNRTIPLLLIFQRLLYVTKEKAWKDLELDEEAV